MAAKKPPPKRGAGRTSRTPKKARATPKPAPKRATAKRATRAGKAKPDWTAAFLEAFEDTLLVSAACAAAKVGRSTVYDRRKTDETFAAAWADIEEASVDRLEREAFRRAVEGVEHDRTYDKDGKLLYTEIRYSDTLLIFLLKARKPATYRENVKVELGGEDGGPVIVDVLNGRDPASVSPATRRRIERELAKEKASGDSGGAG